MKNSKQYLLVIIFFVIFFTVYSFAQNPIITNQFTADPSARVFEGKVYLYPSHDILAGEGRGRVGWFCMEDYHVFSSDNLTDWTDHGVIVSQDKVPWVNSKSYACGLRIVFTETENIIFISRLRLKIQLLEEVFQLELLYLINLMVRLLRSLNLLKVFVELIRIRLLIKTDRLIYTGQREIYM